MANGADCAETLTDKTHEMTLTQWLDFLEPQDNPPRGGAICMSSDDFAKVQIAIEQACRKLGGRCTKEAQATMKQISTRVSRVAQVKRGRGN